MDNKIIEEKIRAVEVEMKALGLWQNDPLPEEAYNIQEAFGADKMSLAQWLQFILIPRVKDLLKSGGPWPEQSQVGIYAAQQYLFLTPSPTDPNLLESQGSMENKEMKLVTLLYEFDNIFNKE